MRSIQQDMNKVFNMDCLEYMKQLPDKCVDLVLTDPPYGIGYKSNVGSKEYRSLMQSFDWDDNFNFSEYHAEIWRLMKDESDIRSREEYDKKESVD